MRAAYVDFKFMIMQPGLEYGLMRNNARTMQKMRASAEGKEAGWT